MAACAVAEIGEAEEQLPIAPDVGEGEDNAAVRVGAGGDHVEGGRVRAWWEFGEAAEFLKLSLGIVTKVGEGQIRRWCA